MYETALYDFVHLRGVMAALPLLPYRLHIMRGPIVRDRDFPDNANLQAMGVIDICGMV